MPTQVKKKTSVTTIKARQKFAKSHADGTPVPKITHVGWGEGGVDISGEVIEPSETLEIVPDEFLKKPIKSAGLDESGLVVTIIADVHFTDEGVIGRKLSSCGLYDEEGDLIAVKNFGDKTIDDDTRIEIEWREEF